jgi:hypothetical protein
MTPRYDTILILVKFILHFFVSEIYTKPDSGDLCAFAFMLY